MFALACNIFKNNVEFLSVEISSKKVRVNNVDFSTIKITSKKGKLKKRGYFDQWNYVEKSKWKRRGFFDQRNYVEKSTFKQHGFFDEQNYIKKVRGNDVEIRRNLTFDVSMWYRRWIDVDSTWCARWVVHSNV